MNKRERELTAVIKEFLDIADKAYAGHLSDDVDGYGDETYPACSDRLSACVERAKLLIGWQEE